MLNLLANWSTRILAAMLCLILRERARALASAKLGDPTPQSTGFLSRNLWRHIEPVGLFLTVIFGFGWGRPTPMSPLHYRDRRRGVLVVYSLSILVNLVVGLASALLHHAYAAFAPGTPADLFVLHFLTNMAILNLATAIFNLLPVYPLDGMRILQVFLPPNGAMLLVRNEKKFQLAMMLLVVFGFFNLAIDPMVRFLLRL